MRSSSVFFRSKSVDVGELVRVYTALHSLPEAQDLTRSISITTTILVEKSPEIAKQFLEELSQNVSVTIAPPLPGESASFPLSLSLPLIRVLRQERMLIPFYFVPMPRQTLLKSFIQ